MINRKADARWTGDLKSGTGTIKLGSGAFEGPYSFGTRFESAQGTNPEELIGAAHSGCFSMQLASSLSKAGHTVRSIATTATVTLDKTDAGMSITGIALVTRGEVSGISDADFQRFAEEAKSGCIVSRALASVPITLQATNSA